MKSTQVTCHCQVKSSQVECDQVDGGRLWDRFQPQVGSCFCTAATRRSIPRGPQELMGSGFIELSEHRYVQAQVSAPLHSSLGSSMYTHVHEIVSIVGMSHQTLYDTYIDAHYAHTNLG